MSAYPLKSSITNTTIILFILASVPYLFAQGKNQELKSPSKTVKEEDILTLKEMQKLSSLQKQARLYRVQGTQFQSVGDLDTAVSFYIKAIELDPMYAVAYNDLGVVYESKGFIDKAEEFYLRAIKIDPAYLSPYSNLALLYENKRNFDKASYYWQKRIELGLGDDPWTQKAKRRLADIQMVSGGRFREQDVLDLTKDVLNDRYVTNEDKQAFVKNHFEKAKLYYKKGNNVTALKEAINALQVDPSNKEIEDFVEKVQTRLLSK